MSQPRTDALKIGDRIRLDRVSQTVAGFAGNLVRLADEHGSTSVLHLSHILADPTLERLGEHRPAPLLPAWFLNTVPKDEIARAECCRTRPPVATGGGFVVLR